MLAPFVCNSASCRSDPRFTGIWGYRIENGPKIGLRLVWMVQQSYGPQQCLVRLVRLVEIKTVGCLGILEVYFTVTFFGIVHGMLIACLSSA